MRFAALVLAVAVLAAGAPALAQTDPTAAPPPAAGAPETGAGAADPAQPAAEAEQPAEEELICRTVQRTESRLRARRERICGTRDQWEHMQDQAARDMNRVGSVQGGGTQ